MAHYWLMGKTVPYKSAAAISIDSGFGTRPNLRLLIEANDHASKETAGTEEVWQRNEKGDWKERMGKGNKGKGVVEKACEEIPIYLKAKVGKTSLRAKLTVLEL